jgi:hypothetical protein
MAVCFCGCGQRGVQKHHVIYEQHLRPDSVYEFAEETLGAGPAYEYLRRRYAGPDARLDGLLVRYTADDPVHVDGNDTHTADDHGRR